MTFHNVLANRMFTYVLLYIRVTVQMHINVRRDLVHKILFYLIIIFFNILVLYSA